MDAGWTLEAFKVCRVEEEKEAEEVIRPKSSAAMSMPFRQEPVGTEAVVAYPAFQIIIRNGLIPVDSSPLAGVYKSALRPGANIGITQPPADDLADPSELATKVDWTPWPTESFA
jgi:hypothetical protein